MSILWPDNQENLLEIIMSLKHTGITLTVHLLALFFFVSISCGLYMALLKVEAQDKTGNMMRENGSNMQDKASVHGMPALPTELNGSPC